MAVSPNLTRSPGQTLDRIVLNFVPVRFGWQLKTSCLTCSGRLDHFSWKYLVVVCLDSEAHDVSVLPTARIGRKSTMTYFYDHFDSPLFILSDLSGVIIAEACCHQRSMLNTFGFFVFFRALYSPRSLSYITLRPKHSSRPQSLQFYANMSGLNLKIPLSKLPDGQAIPTVSLIACRDAHTY